MSAMEMVAVRACRDAGARVVAPDYVHHVPGRLRFKADALKRDAARLDAVCGGLAALAGVRSVSTNAVTGSVIVGYDPDKLKPADLCAALQRRGLTVPPRAENAAHLPALAERIAATLVESILEKLAVTLIAAVI